MPEVPALVAGRTLVIAESGDLERYNLDLRLARRRSTPGESAVLVTTETDAEWMVRRYRSVTDGEPADSLGVVDTVSGDQNLPATYAETPTAYVPGPHEIERLSMALGDVTLPRSREVRRRHLVFQSLTPLLESVDSGVVTRFVRRTTEESRTIDGFSIFRIDFTAHDDATMARVRELADLLLWVEESASGRLDFELEHVRSRP